MYIYQADAFRDALQDGLREVPQMSIADSLGNAKVLDRWLEISGVSYIRDSVRQQRI